MHQYTKTLLKLVQMFEISPECVY